MFHVGQQVNLYDHANCMKCQTRWAGRGTILKIIRCWLIVVLDGGQVLGFLDDEVEPVLTEAMLTTEAA